MGDGSLWKQKYIYGLTERGIGFVLIIAALGLSMNQSMKHLNIWQMVVLCS